MNDDFMDNIKSNVNSFAENQKQLHEAMCNPDMSNILDVIDSKKEKDKEERFREAEIQRRIDEAVKKEQLKLEHSYQLKLYIISIVCTLIAGSLSYILGKYF